MQASRFAGALSKGVEIATDQRHQRRVQHRRVGAFVFARLGVQLM